MTPLSKELLIAALGVNTPIDTASCKKWALKQGYVIYSAIRPGSRVYGTAVVQKTCGGDYLFYGAGETELDAIIDSCEWILKPTR